ncbi:M23 family metallopeptidase [Ferruginibacter sp. HRS2-29]|uniref:M23 family metallopeptidase n=1 Tax=Ferruginibacter sp. HRS2-29 TaxID=2487334 RepID=UPI0020CD51BD|nr:M23 family metallopeptidase [Ferruginibacter sp. HRS2-29]
MKYIFHYFLSGLFLTVSSAASAQFFPVKKYPQGYFQWPIDAKVGLAANFGELRPNHYHMGLDCRSDQKENRPVFAAAAGYVAKIKIEPYGFGRCIYINHPNGLTTLYAHLNDFNPEIEQYITDQQYKLQKWNVFIDVPANLLKVQQGDMIAYSGNTGGSQGPHLHFEVRDTKTDKVLNPLLFGFPITDNIAPDVLRLAVYDRRLSTYEQSPKIYPLKKINGVYLPAGGKITVSSDQVSFAITAWDRYTGSSNQNGIYKAVLYDNEKPVSGFEIDSIGYDETRYLNAHIDYKTRAVGGPWLQHLSRLPGYTNGIYKTDGSNGVISLAANEPHEIKVEVSDAAGNMSEVKFTLNAPSITEVVGDNTNNGGVKFQPGNVNIFENNDVRFYLPENALYDFFTFRYIQPAIEVYGLGAPVIPIQGYFPIKINASANRLPFADTSKVVMERNYGGKTDYKKAVYEKGWYKASFREFGYYRLLLDITPPSIVSKGLVDGMNASKLTRIIFTVSDNTEELNSFNAFLDGKWLRFSNDKGRNFIYKFDERCPPGEHELRVVAEDQVGNKTERIYHFTR